MCHEFPPLPPQPIMSPGRRGWPNIWLRRVLTASGVGAGGAAWEGVLDGLEADSPVFGVCATLRAPSLLNETSLEQSAADQVPQQVGRLPLLYFSMLIK